MKIGITDRGYPGFEKAVSRFERNTIREVKRIVAETAEMMASQMKSLAPVSTIDGGNLRQSISVDYEKGGLRAVITVGAEYGIYIEFGVGIYAEGGDGRKTPWIYWSDKLNRFVWTRGMKAQSFYRPSIEIGMNHFKNEMNKL
jgi:HK97 gp10 family phage protein